MRRSVRFLALALLCACAPRATRPTPVASPAAERPEAASTRVEARVQRVGEAWEVTYTFPAPVQALRFGRLGHGFRQTHWKVLEPAGVQVRAEQDRDVLAASAPLRRVRLRIDGYVEKPEKDYQVFIPYSSGGWLLYTGALGLESLESGEPLAQRVTLVPSPGEHVVVGGRASAAPVQWEDSPQGTYAYFGKDPVVQDGVAAVVDAGMPRWLLEPLRALLPRAFAHYAERTGQPLTFTPSLFVTYGEHPTPGSVSGNGGSLPGLIQLDVRLGRERQVEGDALALSSVLELVAHESAHLWNGQLFTHEEQGGDWMHEGGAEAFALEALVQLGALPEAHYRTRLEGALAECLFNLEGEPLTASSRPGKFTNYYRCGLTLFALAEASARVKDPHADAFTLWSRVFARGGPERTYDGARVFAAFEEAGVDADTLALLRRLVHGPTAGLERPLRAALQRLGFAPEASDAAAPEALRAWVGRRAARFALRDTCGEVGLVPAPGGGLRVQSAAPCARLGEHPVVTHVAGHDVRRAPLLAYDAVQAHCQAGEAIEVRLAGAPRRVSLPCTTAVLPRPPYLRFGRLPLAGLPPR